MEKFYALGLQVFITLLLSLLGRKLSHDLIYITKQAGSAACCSESQAVRQVLVQRVRGLFKCFDLENGGLPLKDHLPFLLKSAVLTGIGRGGLFFYPIIL